MDSVKLLLPKMQKIVILFCIVACAFLFGESVINANTHEKGASVISLTEGWDIAVNGKSEKNNASLPYQSTNDSPKFIDAYNTIPENSFNVPMVSFVSFQKNVWIYLDNQIIYEKVFEPNSFNKNSPGSGTIIAAIPQASVGKEIHIKFESVVKGDRGPITPVEIVSGEKMTGDMVGGNKIVLAVMSAMVCIGILLLTICTLYQKMGFGLISLISLSLIVLSLSLWTLCNGRTIEFFSTNWVLNHNIEYISFFMLPLSIWMYINYNWENSSLLAKLMRKTMFAFFAGALTFKCLMGIDFYYLLPIFHVLIVANIPTIMIEIVKNYKNRPPSFRIFAMGVMMLAAGAIIDLIRYYTVLDESSKATIFIWGGAIMLVMLILSFLFSTKEKIDSSFGIIASKNLEAEHRRYEYLINNTQDIFMDWNIEDDTLYFSDKYEKYFGTKPIDSDLFRNIKDSKMGFEYSRKPDEVHDALMNGSLYEEVRATFTDVGGKIKWFDTVLTPILNTKGKVVRITGIIKDVTESKKLEDEFADQRQQLQINKELYLNILEADISNDVLTGENAVELASALDMEGKLSYDGIIRKIAETLTHEDFKDAYIEMMSRKRILSLYENGIPSFDYECIERTDGVNYKWIRITARVFKSGIDQSIRIISYVKNIDEEKKREFELLDNSQKDSLTGLLNKGATKKIIDEFLKTQEDSTEEHAFLMIDIDHFKNINDTLGHAMGDLAITEISQKLKAQIRESDIVGRVGGDEFAALIKGASDMEALAERCKELCEEFNYYYSQNDKNCEISISVGIAIYPQQGMCYDDLYNNADIALYASKEGGRNTFTFFRG